MTAETIELLKNWTPGKFPFPGVMQQKFDGVPVKITQYGISTSGLVPLTRQGEYVKSIKHILEEAAWMLVDRNSFIVGELYDESLPFQTISGQVRDTKEQHSNLVLKVFDGCIGFIGDPWSDRIAQIYRNIANNGYASIAAIPGRFVSNAEQVETEHASFMARQPNAEGVVIHSCAKLWSPGKRCWGTQRIKASLTTDVVCIGFEEAKSAAGEPKGMVGRGLYMHQAKGGDKVAGFGPGCLTHPERRELWRQVRDGTFKPRVAEIKSMEDQNYDALRQPTFVRWRADKDPSTVR